MEYQKYAPRPFWVRYYSENESEMEQNEDDMLATLEKAMQAQDAEAFNDLMGDFGQAIYDLPTNCGEHRVAKYFFKMSALLDMKAISFLSNRALVCEATVAGLKAVVAINIRYDYRGNPRPVFAVYAGKSTAYFDSENLETFNEIANAIKAMATGYTEGIEELF